MRRVVHVGPLMAPGGMASVIETLAANPPEGWRASSCNTFSRRGKLQKLRRWRIAKNEIKNGSFDLIHIHSASDWSYKRKLSIAKIANAPVIFHIHSGKFDRFCKGIFGSSVKKELGKPNRAVIVLEDRWIRKLDEWLPTNSSVVRNHSIPVIGRENFTREG